MNVIISKSDKADKKLKAVVDGKTIHFGATGYSDYRLHKNEDRKKRYVDRHQKNEKWGADGVETAGFGLNMFSGISQHYKQVLTILTNGLIN